jgi:GNAT superfamily N-acetyltransferase
MSAAKVPRLTLRPLTPERWPDLEALFEARGCSVARGCWCMYYRYSGAGHPTGSNRERAAASKAALKRLAAGARPPGLIGYRGRTPVGWISLGPREDFRKLAASPVMKPVDDEPVWSVVCFVVPAEHRGQGVAHALLAGAKAWARRQGARLLEGYPVDKATRGADDAMWFGSKSLFDAAGFEEVARRKPTRPVVRVTLKR